MLPALVQDFFEHSCRWCAPHTFVGQHSCSCGCGCQCHTSIRYPANGYIFPMPPASMHGLKNRKQTQQFRDDIRMHVQACNLQTPVSWKSRVPINVVPGFLPEKSARRRKAFRPRVVKVCVGILFVRPQGAPDQDVDNTAKAFLDGLKGKHGLIHDDMDVGHLECFKAESLPDYSVNIACGYRDGQGVIKPTRTDASSFIAARIQLATPRVLVTSVL